MRKLSAAAFPLALRTVLTFALAAAVSVPVPAAAGAGAGDESTSTTGAAGQGCPPEIIELPVTSPGESGAATALNDHGWVVGYLGARAVLWRDRQPPLDLGVNGVPVDINEYGVVAIGSFLWENGILTRLKASRYRPDAGTVAINDVGVAVGSIAGPGEAFWRPVVWRDGTLQRLLLPHGSAGVAIDINNAGLAVGYVERDPAGQPWSPVPWWWNVNTGRGGPLGRRLGGRIWRGVAVSVDDKGRIVGDLSGIVVKWWHRRAAAQTLFRFPRQATSLHAAGGTLTGNTGGFRGFSAAAYIARLTDDLPTALPNPPPREGPLPNFDNTFGLDIAGGVTAYAPHGGITVAGRADHEEFDLPILWTCTQTYLPTSARFCGGRRITVNLVAGDRPTARADVIWGTVFRDVINGRGGRDTICARGGADADSGRHGQRRRVGGRRQRWDPGRWRR